MALKRLDEEFELKPGTQLLPYMKRLLPSLEARFQSLEEVDRMLKGIADDIRAAALLRMNEILLPATEDIIAVTKLGFLIAPISDMLYDLTLGYMGVYVDDGSQRRTFTPSPYLIVEADNDPSNYAIARMMSYDQKTGLLEMDVTAIHGDPNAKPWTVTSTPGMADSAKLYHDAIAPMHTDVAADYEAIQILHAEIIAAAQALAESGLDTYNFIRRDGTIPFQALQEGITPPQGQNDGVLATTAWARARMVEYAGLAVKKSGDVMTGHLTLSGAPTQPDHAVTRQYIDDLLGGAGGPLTITTANPAIRLQVTGTQQDRMFEGLGVGGVHRWSLVAGDQTPEVGGNAGSDFVLRRYSDMGTLIDVPLVISRATGNMMTKSLDVDGRLDVHGDIDVYRPNAPSTGVMYMNQARSAYHYFDGSSHVLQGGGLSVGGNINAAHLSVNSITTNGHYLTTWGMTSHGSAEINGNAYVRGTLQVETTGPLITLYDTDWGPMHLHHQSDNIGFLNNGGGWIHYINNAGHMWTARSTAGCTTASTVRSRNWYAAWDAANYRYNQLVSAVRWAYVGDLPTSWNGGNLGEPYGGSAITGFAAYDSYQMYVMYFRFRQLQYCVAGGWYASYFA